MVVPVASWCTFTKCLRRLPVLAMGLPCFMILVWPLLTWALSRKDAGLGLISPAEEVLAQVYPSLYPLPKPPLHIHSVIQPPGWYWLRSPAWYTSTLRDRGLQQPETGQLEDNHDAWVEALLNAFIDNSHSSLLIVLVPPKVIGCHNSLYSL